MASLLAVVEQLSQLAKLWLSLGLVGDVDDIDLRWEKYGVNVIPQKPPPSFFVLAWEALQDPLLIVLSVAAFITIGLSFYEAPPEEAAGKSDVQSSPELKVEARVHVQV